MAIGTAAAIGLGVAGLGQAIGGMSANKAAGKAADVSLETARENNALARETRDLNFSALEPYAQVGPPATGQINALLGLNTAPQTNWEAYVQADPAAYRDWQMYHSGGPVVNGITPDSMSLAEYGQYHWRNDGGRRDLSGFTSNPADNARKAFDSFRDSTGYKFRFDQGMSALNGGFAGRGGFQSGAAMKAATEYGQNFASNEFGNYLNALGNQQGVGLSGASAQAGVGQNYVNTFSQNNNNAGNAAANALLYKGANNPLASSMGLIGGGLFGYGK